MGMVSRAARLAAMLASLASVLLAVMAASASAGGSLAPSPARGKGEQCVEQTDVMRRNHMGMLMHQRDATMYDGVRTKRHSLKECLACHAVPGDDGRAVTVESPKHFCRTCHDYAAVRVDCFECHASRPGEADKVRMGQSVQGERSETAVLGAFLASREGAQ